MADRRTNKRRRTETSTPYDMENPNNWTVDILRKKLEEMGIWTPSSMSKANLKVLFIENSKQRRTPAQTNTLNVVANTANETNQRRTSRFNRTIASTNANNIDHDVRPETMLRPNVDLTRAEIDDQSPEQQSARADNMAAPMQNHSGVIQQLQTTINLLLTREMQRETVAHDVSDNNNKLDAAMARLSGTQDASGSQRDLHHSSDSDVSSIYFLPV
ncbi:uncharacterized protein [Argopecten irradians]|uniref:uncharacterized protein n=1 Tax=Argopecten irradians TaxID=31199 RepID=UPI0037203F59